MNQFKRQLSQSVPRKAAAPTTAYMQVSDTKSLGKNVDNPIAKSLPQAAPVSIHGTNKPLGTNDP